METGIKQEPVHILDMKQEIKARSCCLCEEGNVISLQLIERFRTEHSQGKISL